MSKIHSFYFLFILIILGHSGEAQNDKFDAINEFQQLEILQNASWGLKLINVKNKEVVIDINSHTSLIPASTMKLFSSGMALKILGSDFTFKTFIAIDGELEKSELNGDLIIIGGGDPTFENEEFYETSVLDLIKKILQKNGIQKITGDIIVDLSHYPKDLTPHTWVYQDMGNYYGASPSALTYKNNTFKIYFSRENKEFAPTEILEKSTKGQDLKLENQVSTGTFGSGDRAYVYGVPEGNKYIVRGAIPPGNTEFSIKASLTSSADFFLYELRNYFNESNIKIAGENRVRYFSDSNFQIIDSIVSPELLDIITEVNVKSNNLYAEQIYVETQFQKYGDLNSSLITDFFKMNDLNSDGLFMEDGSGLSRYNSITLDNQIDFLEYMYESDVFDLYLNSLAEGGKTGTIENMFKNTKSVYRLKSGTLSRVKAYSGYVINQKGDTLAISFMINNYSGPSRVMKKKMEELIINLCE